jgi:hypothetical protein
MSYVFSTLAVLSAAFLAWNLVPIGFGKLKDVNANLPTFTSLFGRFGMPVLVGVGAIETVVPVLLVISTVINSAFTGIFVGLIALVMFGATAVHVVVWKNSPKQALTLFAVSLLTAVFSALAV